MASCLERLPTAFTYSADYTMWIYDELDTSKRISYSGEDGSICRGLPVHTVIRDPIRVTEVNTGVRAEKLSGSRGY